MKDNYVFYNNGGTIHKISESDVSEFEKDKPFAKVYMSANGKFHLIGIDEKKDFLNDFPNASFVDLEVEKAKKQKATQPSAEQQEEEKPSLWQSISEGVVRAQNDSLGFTSNPQQTADSVEVAPETDKDMANMVIDSHNRNKEASAAYIDEIDKEYYANKPEEPKKSFWQKLGDFALNAQTNAMEFDDAYSIQQKKEDREKGQDYIDAKIAQNISGKVEDKVNEYKNPSKTFVGGVLKGTKDAITDLDTWDASIGLEQAARVHSITKKLDNGESLTKGEQMIVDALVDDLSSDIYMSSEFGRGYKAGKVTGESLPFMIETALNPASKLGGAITKKFGKEIFKKVSTKLGSQIARAVVYGTRVGADLAGAAAMSATTSQARIMEDALNRLSGQVDFTIGEDGTLKFNGFTGGEDTAFKAYAKAYGANTIEHFSEMIGNYFAPIGQMVKGGTANLAGKVGLNKVKSLLTEMTPNGFGALINDFTEQTQWQGVFGEFAEEMIGGALSGLVGIDDTLNKYDENGNINPNWLFEKDNMIDTFLGVAIIGGAVSAAKTVGYTTPETRFNREITRAKKSLNGKITDEEMAQLEAFANNPMGADYANLAPFFDKEKSEESKLAVGRYLAAVMEKQGYQIAKQANMRGTEQGMKEMRQAFQLGGTMTEADLYDVNEAEAQAMQALNDTGIFDVPEGADAPFASPDILDYSSYELFALAQDNKYTLEERQALRDLAIIKNAKEGLNDALNKRVRAYVTASDAITNSAATDGIVTVAEYNGQKVYVKGGVKVSNGSIVKPNNVSGYPVEIVDSMTGEVATVDSSEISNAQNRDVNQYNAEMGQIITESFNQRFEQSKNTKSAKSKLADVEKLVGQRVYIDNGQGNNMTEVEVMQILPNGEVVLKGKKGDLGGQSVIRVDSDAFYDSLTRDANGNPIYDMSKFRSQSENIKSAQDRLYNRGEQETATPEADEAPVEEESAEVGVPSDIDFREQTIPIMIGGVPVEVEVTSQDNTSDSIAYTYIDENGDTKYGSSTIGAFMASMDEAKNYKPTETPTEIPTEVPATDITEEVPTTDNVPSINNVPTQSTSEAPNEEVGETKEIDWDALFEQDAEAYFRELQNAFGGDALDMLNAVITATQKKLDNLNKVVPDTDAEIFANVAKKKALQNKIDILNGMVARLTAPAETASETPAETSADIPAAPAAPAEVPTETPTTTEEVPAEPVAEAPSTETPTEEAPAEQPQGEAESGFKFNDNGVCVNPETISVPPVKKGYAIMNEVKLAQYNGKWGSAVDAHTGTGGMGSPLSKDVCIFDTKEEAITSAYKTLVRFRSTRNGDSRLKDLDNLIKHLETEYPFVKATAAPTATAPTPVENPAREAEKREKSLATQLLRYDLTPEEKRDMAFNVGKAVGDYFATREEYDAYEQSPSSVNLGDYLSDFERGVEESFANRKQNTGDSQGNSVPLENQPKEENNGEPGETATNGPSVSDNSGRTTDEGAEGGNQAAPKVGKGKANKGKAPKQVEDKYPARKGNATQKLLVDTFGFNKVEIPNSRKETLNTIYDFMMAMSKMLGISPKSIGQGGWLDVASLRSNASSSAEHSLVSKSIDKSIVKATLKYKYSTLSGLAHEWWHALDHALSYFETGKGTIVASEIPSSRFTGRKETWDAVQQVIKAIKKSGHESRMYSLKFPRRYTDYLAEPTEMAARAFDEYIKSKFAEAGIQIENATDTEFVAQPTAEEMEVIAPAFDNLFNVLQEKEGKNPGTSVLYHIGEEVDERMEGISDEAVQLADDAVALMTEEGGIETVAVSDEQEEQMIEATGVNADFMVAPDRPVFISNAAMAVASIKQEKATPEQWLKMIEKAGGLKAGEDKWMGLSDWLKASDKKTLTKQEVLDFINENMIAIEEVNYAETNYFEEDKKLIAAVNDEFLALRKKAEEAGEWTSDAGYIAFEKMKDKYGDDFGIAFDVMGGELYVSNRVAASRITGVDLGVERAIDETRIGYTTNGLSNNKEIALVVPTIEPWNEEDDIHFGDAGEGRAVAWIRFGETEVTVQDETQQRLNEIYDRLAELEMKVSSSTGITQEEYEERSRLRKERDELQEIKPKTQRVLVIDEVQSKRHQEGRESGYKVSREKADAEMDKFMKRMHDKYDFSSSTPFDEVFNDEEMRELARLNMQQHRATFGTTSVPDAPFDKNWHELAMKRMLRYAAENGYDAIAWTKGEQQTERYQIGGVVDFINVNPRGDEKVVLIRLSNGGVIEDFVNSDGEITQGQHYGQKLSDVVGKEVAEQILTTDETYYDGGDLKVGGEGMKGFYDKMLPAFMNKYGKKWGIKVADITLPNVEEAGRVMHSVPVTDAMKESVMEGQPMFMKRPNGKIYGWTDGKKIYLTKHGFNPNTRIHEYTHLWAKAMMQKNPKGWQSVKDLLRGTPAWDAVLNDANYSDIHNNEDAVASEVLSRISGKENAAKLEKMAQKMIDEAKGTMRKLEARGLVQRIKDALNEFWSWVGTELFGIERFESVDQITDRVLWDLMNKTDLGELSEGQVETQIVTDPKVSISNENSVSLPNISQAIKSGVWNDAATNELNKIAEDVEQGLAILKRYTPQEHRGLLRGGRLLVEASILSRGSEADIRTPKKGYEGLREKADQTIPVITQWAKANGVWHEYSERSDEEISRDYLDSGTEAQVFNLGNGKVEKIIGLDYYVDPQLALDRIAIHNALFPETNLEVVGFGTNKRGEFAIIVHQQTIAAFPTDQEKINAYIESIGFKLIDDTNHTFINDDLYLSDLHQENVLSNDDKKYYVIDGDFRLNTAEVGVGGNREIDDSIVRDDSDNLLFRSESNPITPEMDADYLAAVERGDMETAQRMVLEAAKLAMPDTKVVNENGNPKVVYHGSNSMFTEFDKSKIGSATGTADGRGFYFTTDRDYASGFKTSDGQLFEVFLNIENPLSYDKKTITKAQLRKILKEADRVEFASEGEHYMLSNYANYNDVGIDGAINAAANLEYDYADNDVELVGSLIGGSGNFELIMDAVAKVTGKSSMIAPKNNGTTHYVVTESSAIKSAEPVTYDDAGNVIPLSERFNPEKKDIRYRHSDIQDAAVDFLVGEERNKVIERAVNEEAAKLGVTVTYKTREQMPKGHKNDKGYYNTKTGEIVVCTENAKDIPDAIQTILHEAVVHKGLRQLMGDRFDEFINRVYDALDAETRAKVDELADKHYKGNKAVAMEEYMASLAETEDFAKTSVWDKIKSIFNSIINSILGRNDMKIGDNELRYILRASYANMVNPRNMETIEGWAKDVRMREEYKINEASPEIMSRTGIDATEAARETAKQVYDRIVNMTWQEFQRQLQDAYQPVRIAIDAIQQETGNIPIEDYENYLLIQNQSSSRSRVETDKFKSRYYSPIVDQVNHIIDRILESRGYDIKDEYMRARAYTEVIQYLMAKHGLERNKYYQEHKTKIETQSEKEAAIKELQNEHNSMIVSVLADTSRTEEEREAHIQNLKDLLEVEIAEIMEREEVPDLRDYSGLTSLFGFEPKDFREAEEVAQRLVDNFEDRNYEEIEELWKRINAATNKTLMHSYESGLLSRQQYNDIKSMFKYYIPLRGFEETTAEDVYAYARFEGNRFNPAVMKTEGRTSVAYDPIATIMNMAESEFAQGNKNRAKQALYYFIVNRPIVGDDGNQTQNTLMRVEDVWYVQNVDENGNTTYSIAAPNHEAGETYQEFEERMRALEAEEKAYKSKKGQVDLGMRFQKQTNKNAHYVYLKINGVEKAIYINGDPKAADAINGANRPQPSGVESTMRKINRAISSTFTNYSLEFTARNYFRDMVYAHINMGVRESDPEYRMKFRKNWRHNNLLTMLKMLNAYRAGEYDGREDLTADEKAFVDFMDNGGQTGYTLINSVESHKKELEKAIERMQKGIDKGGIKDTAAFKYTLGAIELLNEASELVTRFAAFKTSRDVGRGIIKSIADAKEITVNFNTKGAQDGKGFLGIMTNYLGWSKYFFNASVQGVQNITAMAKANKLKFGKVVGGVFASGIIVPMLTSVLAELFGGDDEEYWNIPEWERQNNLCLVIGKGKYVKIPLPIGFREVYALGDMVAAMAWDKKFDRDAMQVGMDMANKITSVLLPINPLEGAVNGLSLWQSVANTVLPSSTQFLVQNATNIDWKGAPLQKEYTFNANDPQWMKAYASNPEWMKGLSKWCNEHIGAGDMQGWDWSPEKLDNTLSNLFGGIYTLIKKTGRSVSMIWNEENRNLSNIPLAGVAIGSGIDNDERYVEGEYYDEKDYYDDRIGHIKRRADKFDLNLKDVFIEGKGAHHPKMQEIYNNKEFEFMKRWYLGHEGNPQGKSQAEISGLNKMQREIKKLEAQIEGMENPSDGIKAELERRRKLYEDYRRRLVHELMELD